MPRGGKRPGAGAPRGNFNAATDAYFLTRAPLINQYIQLHPHPRRLAYEMLRAGIFRLTPSPVISDMRLFAAFILRHLIEFPHQSMTIKDPPRCPESTPPDEPPVASNATAAINQPPATAEKPTKQENQGLSNSPGSGNV